MAGRIADIALSQAGLFARRAAHRKITGRGGLARRFAAALLMRVAARSVPGALAVSGAVAAGALLKKAASRRSQRKAKAVEEVAD